MVLEFLKEKKLTYDKLPEPNEVGILMNEIHSLTDSNNKIISEAARKFGICVPTEFSRILIFSSLSKKSVLKNYIIKVQHLVELFVEFFKLVSQFNRDATEISGDKHFVNANLEVISEINEMENIHSQMILLANEIVEEIERSINKCNSGGGGGGRGSQIYLRQPILLKQIPEYTTNSGEMVYTPFLRDQTSIEPIEHISKYFQREKVVPLPSIQKLLNKNTIKRVILTSGGMFFFIVACASVVIGAVLAPFTCGASLLGALASIFMIAGGSTILVGSSVAGLLCNKFFIEKDLDLVNSLETLKQIKFDIEKMLNSFKSSSNLANQLSNDFHKFKIGEYGSIGILCGICNNLLKDPLFFDDGKNNTKNYCKECITNYYKSKQQLAGSNNDEDLFFLPNSHQTFNLNTLQPVCRSLLGIIKKSEEKYDEWEKKLLLMLGVNKICYNN
ncbi:hypothetical protein ACTA71_005122 [Dictyostelium dimigraforme]